MNFISRLSFILVILFSLFLSGCYTVKTYEPDELKSLDKDEIATLTCPFHTKIHKIDRVPPSAIGSSLHVRNIEDQKKCQILLKEGKHSMEVQMDKYGYYTSSFKSPKRYIQFTVEGGKSYKLATKINKITPAQYTWEIYIQDLVTMKTTPLRLMPLPTHIRN